MVVPVVGYKRFVPSAGSGQMPSAYVNGKQWSSKAHLMQRMLLVLVSLPGSRVRTLLLFDGSIAEPCYIATRMFGLFMGRMYNSVSTLA